MASIEFTSHLRKVAPGAVVNCSGANLTEVLDAVAPEYPRLKSYLIDDQGRLRPHIAVFIDGTLRPRATVLAEPLSSHSEIYVFQALSGG